MFLDQAKQNRRCQDTEKYHGDGEDECIREVLKATNPYNMGEELHIKILKTQSGVVYPIQAAIVDLRLVSVKGIGQTVNC